MDTRSQCAAAAAVEATIYFWHLTLKLTLYDGSGPMKLPQHSTGVWLDLFVLYWVMIMDNRDWAARDTVSDCFSLMY